MGFFNFFRKNSGPQQPVFHLPALPVREDALAALDTEPWRVVAGLVDTMNLMTGRGYLTRDDLPAEANQAYHADYYLAQVNNGGHSQFIGNGRSQQEFIWRDTEAGLEAMGATQQLAIFRKMLAWAKKNGRECEAQDGFQNRAKALDELDTAFYAANKDADLSALNARWIASWPFIESVPEDRYLDRIDALCAGHPLRAQRMRIRQIGRLQVMLTDPFQSAAGYVAALQATPEFLVSIDRGGRFIEIDGQNHVRIGVETDAGRRVAVHGAIGTILAMPDDSPIGDPDGKKLRLTPDMAEDYAKQAGERMTGAAAYLLTQMIGVPSESVLARPLGLHEGSVLAWVRADGRDYTLLQTDKLAVLCDRDNMGETLAKVTAAEIKAAIVPA